MFVQLLSVLRHLDVLLGECWVCQSWSLGVFGPLWGISPGSASKGECGGASAAGFGELGQGREGWGLWPLYRVTHTPKSWSLETSKHKCTISWLTCPVSPLRATARIAHRITHDLSAILDWVPRRALEKEANPCTNFIHICCKFSV